MNVAGRWQAQLPMVQEVLAQFGEARFPAATVVAEDDLLFLRGDLITVLIQLFPEWH